MKIPEKAGFFWFYDNPDRFGGVPVEVFPGDFAWEANLHGLTFTVEKLAKIGYWGEFVGNPPNTE